MHPDGEERELAEVLSEAVDDGRLDPQTGAVRPPDPHAAGDDTVDALWVEFVRDTHPAVSAPRKRGFLRRVGAALGDWRFDVALVAAVLLLGLGASLIQRHPADTTAEEAPPVEPFALGHWHLDRGHPDLAIHPFLKAAEADRTGRADECLAYCYAATASYESAIARADRAIAAGRQTAGVYANRAAARSHRGKPAEAVADCAEALRLDPDCTAADLTRLFAQFQQRKRNGPPLDRQEVIDLEARLAGRTGLSGTSWLLVAEVHLAVADPGENDIRKAVKAVEYAVRAGISKDQVRLNRTLHQRLDGRDDYTAALNERSTPTSPADNPQLVRPVP